MPARPSGANFRFYAAKRQQVIHTNLDSLFNMMRPVINGMRERNFGEKLRWSSSRAMMTWGLFCYPSLIVFRKPSGNKMIQ